MGKIAKIFASLISSLTIFFVFYFPSCGKKERKLSREEEMRNSAISFAKEFARPASNLPLSSHVRTMIRNFEDMVSSIAYMKQWSWNMTSAFSDFYSFFSPDITYLSANYCSGATSCPVVRCRLGCTAGENQKIENEGNKSVRGEVENQTCVIESSGRCYNDYFVFLGSARIEVNGNSSQNSSTATYSAIFSNWHVESIETDEFVSYSGHVNFLAKKGRNNSDIKRDISIDGVADVEELGLKRIRNINFEHISTIKINISSEKNFSVALKHYEIMDFFCFVIIELPFFDFKCVRNSVIREINLQSMSEARERKFVVKGKRFETVSLKGDMRWVDMSFDIELIYYSGICKVADGEINFSSGEEKLKLVFSSRNYGERGCNLECPSTWVWEVMNENGQKQRYVKSDCLPPL